MAYEDSPIIGFPEGMPIAQIVVVVNRLNNKMAEYKKRMQTNPNDLGTKYKLAIIETLLTRGEVLTQEISERLEGQFSSYDLAAFNNACSVINDYIETGGGNVTKGSF